MQKTIIGLLGKPLAGKDTVADALRAEFPGIATISMGDVIREVKVAGESHRFWPILEGAIAVADAGGIAPDEPTFRCLTELAEEQWAEGKSVVVWVGGPRSEHQIDQLDAWTKENGIDARFLHIDVPDGEVYERVGERKNHGRTDDRSDVIAVRLQEYERVTKPAVDRLFREGRIAMVNGVGERSEVCKNAMEILQFSLMEREITLPPMARR